jgi:hypothetical protein
VRESSSGWGGVAFYRVEARRGKARIGRVAVVNGILNGAITGVKGGGGGIVTD